MYKVYDNMGKLYNSFRVTRHWDRILAFRLESTSIIIRKAACEKSCIFVVRYRATPVPCKDPSSLTGIHPSFAAAQPRTAQTTGYFHLFPPIY